MTGQLYGPTGQLLPKGIGQAVAAMSSRGEVSVRPGMVGGGGPQELAGWATAQTSADGAYLWARDDLVAKIRDLVANEPWAQGAVDRKLDMVVGAGWRPSIKPDAEVLNITPEQANTLGRQIEAAWRTWANDPLCRCDQEQTLNASWLLHVAVMEQEICGDGLAVLRWKTDRNWKYRTALQVIDADRLSNPHLAMDTESLRGGIEFDTDGAPAAYHIRNAHPGDWGHMRPGASFSWTRVPRRQPHGRPTVLHLYRKDRPGQSRGVSRLVAGLGRFKQMARFAQAELANAVINALFAATITSSFDPAVMQGELTAPAINGYQDRRVDFYQQSEMVLEGTRIQHLFPGDELKFLTDTRQTAAFEQFFTVFLRSIASGLGIAYEQIAMDWSKVNYSSARAALVEVWRGIMKARSMVAMMFATPLLLAVTEDALDAGLIQMPEGCTPLYEAPAAWLQGSWIGPPRGWVDPVKEAQAALVRIESGLSTWEDECAEQGKDFEVNLLQLGRERGLWKAQGLTPPALAAMLAVDPATDRPEPTPA